MQHNHFDILIIGAGPAGFTAAIHLGAAGFDVALADKSSGGDKICGDALSGTVMNVLKRLPGNAAEDFSELPGKLPSWGIRFYAPSGQFLDVPFVSERNENTPVPGYIFSRKDFDAFLRHQTEKYPSVKRFENFRVEKIIRNQSGFIASGPAGEISGKILLGGDGINSIVSATMQDQDKHSQICLGVRAYYRGVSGLHPENFIELHFLKDLLPGYLWIFPMSGGMTNVGIGMLSEDVRKNRISLGPYLDEILKSHPILKYRFAASYKVGKTGAHPLPMGPPTHRLSGDGWMLMGDAASLVDPFTGEGIGNAMVSGEIAATVAREALSAGDFSAAFLSSYDERIQKKIYGELAISRKLQHMARYSRLFNFVVRKVNANPSLRNIFTQMYTDPQVRGKLKDFRFYLKLLLK